MSGAWPKQKSRPNHWVSFAIVHQNWKLVTNRDFGYFELYDIAVDVAEENDLKEKEPKVVSELLVKLKVWKESLPTKPTGRVFSALRKE